MSTTKQYPFISFNSPHRPSPIPHWERQPNRIIAIDSIRSTRRGRRGSVGLRLHTLPLRLPTLPRVRMPGTAARARCSSGYGRERWFVYAMLEEFVHEHFNVCAVLKSFRLVYLPNTRTILAVNRPGGQACMWCAGDSGDSCSAPSYLPPTHTRFARVRGECA